jgi:hypothetical protein
MDMSQVTVGSHVLDPYIRPMTYNLSTSDYVRDA